VNLGPHVNTPKDEYGPTFSADGSTLYFTQGELAHPQPNPNLATFDIWQAEVIPIVDFNGDGKVDGKDVLFMAQHWGEKQPLYDIGPTAFGDGVVDVQDLIVLAKYIGKEVHDPTLIAHWAFDETEGGAPRDSASGSEAIVNGGANWQPAGGKVGGALQFDGTNDSVTTGFVLSPAQGPFSVFAWLKGGAPGQVIVSQAGGANWLMVATAKGELMTELKQPGSRGKSLTSSAAITDGAWHRVGFVWDGTNRVLYMDDVEVATSTQAGLIDGTGGLNIGTGSTLAPGTFWSGLIDDVRIYNRVVKP
jgi:hypothetical protein